MSDAESWWAKVRTSNAFVWGIIAFSGTYAFLNALYRFDPDWGIYNTLYSTEASITNAVITAMFVRQFEYQQKQALYELHIAEATKANTEEQRMRGEHHSMILEDHSQKLDAILARLDSLDGCSSSSSSDSSAG